MVAEPQRTPLAVGLCASLHSAPLDAAHQSETRRPSLRYAPSHGGCRSAAPLFSDAELATPGPVSSGPHPPAAAMVELSGAAPLLSPPQRRCLSCSSMEILSAADCLASRCPSSPSGARQADPASHPLQLAIPPVAARWFPLLPETSPNSSLGRSHRRPSSSSVAGHPPCLHGHVQRALFFPVLSPARRNAAARSGHGSSLCRALGVRRIAAVATPFVATRSPGRATRRQSAQPLRVVIKPVVRPRYPAFPVFNKITKLINRVLNCAVLASLVVMLRASHAQRKSQAVDTMQTCATRVGQVVRIE
jgi:hypothetical protein